MAGTTKYYALGSQRIAMRKAGTLHYLFTDHLGSTSVTYNTANSQTQALRYYPWGAVRSGDIPADRRFTGQRWDSTIDLYDYQARFYDPALGRFVQPDTIVPNPGNPQDLNRYTYALNNPLTYNDPSGHAVPVRFRQLEIKLPSWAQSRPIQLALTVACLPISCHVEQGVLRGPTPEEQVTMAFQPMPMSVASGATSNIADDVADDIIGASVKKAEQLVLPGFEDLVSTVDDELPEQIHHLLTNKHSKWTPVFEDIVSKYKLDLDAAWNKAKLPHQGRHPEEYHQWVRRLVDLIDEIAEGDRQKFLKLFNDRIKKPVLEHPEMLNKEWWQ